MDTAVPSIIELKRVSARGAVINVGAQALRLVLRFGYQIAMARLLLPEDFGLVAMAAPVTSFLQLFADLGLSQATIQRNDISKNQLDLLFWINVAIGIGVGGLCIALAPLIAIFFGDARVSNVVVAAGVLLGVGGFGNQHMALLNRNMKYGALALIDVASVIVGLASGVASALLGASYWAIIISQATTTLTIVAMSWIKMRWLPGLPKQFQDVKPLLYFGGNLTIFSFLNFLSRNTDNILIGRFSGEYALGLYDRAFKMMLLPFGQISVPFSKVALPLLSRCQDQPDVYRHAYRRMLEAVLLLLYPGLVFMVGASRPLIVLVLGPRWSGVAPVFALLGADAFVAPLGYSMGWLFVSQDRTLEMRNWSVVTAILFVSCFIVGLPWGPQGVAAGYATAGLIEIAFLWRIATRRGPLPGSDFIQLLIPFLLATACTFPVIIALGILMPLSIWSLLVESLSSYACFVAVLITVPRGRRVIREAMQQVIKLTNDLPSRSRHSRA